MKFIMALSALVGISTAAIQKESFGGIGVQIDSVTNGWQITQVFDNSPASKAGLQKGDLITIANGYTLKSSQREHTLNILRGTPGSTLDLQVTRQDQSLNFSLNRTQIQTALAQVSEITQSQSSAAQISGALLSDKASLYDLQGQKLSAHTLLQPNQSVFAMEFTLDVPQLQNPSELPSMADFQGFLYNAKGEIIHTWYGSGNRFVLPTQVEGAQFYRVIQGNYSTQGIFH